jgi:hypothetical protein
MKYAKRITLTVQDLDDIRDMLSCYCDEGPEGEGWKSKHAEAVVVRFEQAVDEAHEETIE